MKAMNLPMPKGMPVAGAYGRLASGWGEAPAQAEGFDLTPGNTPDEVPEEVIQEVTDDAGSEQPSEELSGSGE